MNIVGKISTFFLLLLAIAFLLNQDQGEKSLNMAGNAKLAKIDTVRHDCKVVTKLVFNGNAALSYESDNGLMNDITNGASSIGNGIKDFALKGIHAGKEVIADVKNAGKKMAVIAQAKK